MARPPRTQFKNALYHVTSRGNARQVIFHTDDDRRRFLRQLQDNLEQYGVILYAWVLMPNHYHLVVRTPQANLGRFMQRLNSSYSLYYRYKHARPGHAFGGRYKAPLVESDEYLRALTRYVHLNPVKTKRAAQLAAKERIRMLEDYPWSSYPDYVCNRPAGIALDRGVLDQYGRNKKEARRRYRAYAQAMVTENDEPLREMMAHSTHALGSAEFVRKVERELAGEKTGQARDSDLQRPKRSIDLAVIDQVVALEFGIEAEDLKRHGRAVGEAKAVAVELAVRLSGRTKRAIGAHYGNISGQAVSMIRRRLKEKRTIDWLKFSQAISLK
jgi:putative transposase